MSRRYLLVSVYYLLNVIITNQGLHRNGIRVLKTSQSAPWLSYLLQHLDVTLNNVLLQENFCNAMRGLAKAPFVLHDECVVRSLTNLEMKRVNHQNVTVFTIFRLLPCGKFHVFSSGNEPVKYNFTFSMHYKMGLLVVFDVFNIYNMPGGCNSNYNSLLIKYFSKFANLNMRKGPYCGKRAK